MDQQAEQPAVQPAEQPAASPVEQPAASPVEQPAEQPAATTTEQPVTPPAATPAAPSGDQPSEEYSVSDYGIFNDAIASTTSYNSTLTAVDETVKQGKTKLSDQAIFMGPIQENCMEAMAKINNQVEASNNNFSSINEYLVAVANAYSNGDKEASSVVLSIDGKGTNSKSAVSNSGGRTGNPVSSVDIPEDLEQSGYTVTCYGKDGWHIGASDEATGISPNTDQAKVHDAWVADGARYKNGIAVMNVDGQDCYLVATTSKLGNVGDTVDVRLANGQTIPCVVADAKNSGDSNPSTYGHIVNNGKVNVLEFEVDTGYFRSKGNNPTTDTWGLDWDSTSRVVRVDNYGRIV